MLLRGEIGGRSPHCLPGLSGRVLGLSSTGFPTLAEGWGVCPSHMGGKNCLSSTPSPSGVAVTQAQAGLWVARQCLGSFLITQQALGTPQVKDLELRSSGVGRGPGATAVPPGLSRSLGAATHPHTVGNVLIDHPFGGRQGAG